MAIKLRNNFNIDKLKLCFNQPEGLFTKISEYSTTNKYIHFNCFTLHIINDGRGKNGDKTPMKIMANVVLSDSTLLGNFVFFNSLLYEGRCFFTFENSALYKVTSIFCGEKYNYHADLDYIIDVLGLELNSYTEIEIALDVNFNIIAKVLKLVSNYQKYDMIYNRKKVDSAFRHIKNYSENYGRSRARRDKFPTIYFKQTKKDGLQLKIYDKTKEIKEANPQKQYIETWNDFGNQKVYRIEFSIKNEQFKKWLEYLNSADCPVPSEWKRFISEGEGEHIAPSESKDEYMRRTELLLLLREYKYLLWQFCADRLIYWRNKANNEIITLLDVAKAHPYAY